MNTGMRLFSNENSRYDVFINYFCALRIDEQSKIKTNNYRLTIKDYLCKNQVFQRAQEILIQNR